MTSTTSTTTPRLIILFGYLVAMWDEASFDVGYEHAAAMWEGREGIKPTPVRDFFATLYLTLRRLWIRLVCHFHGHAIEVESSIGPDSGTEYLSCPRCGFSHTIHYY